MTAEIQSTRVKDWPLTARIDIAGELQKMAATVKGSAGQPSIVGEVVLAPFELIPVVSIAAKTSDVDIANFDSRLPHTALTVGLEAQPVGASVVAGAPLANNSDPGKLAKQRLPVQALDARFALDVTSFRIADMQVDLGAAGKVRGSADIARDHMALFLYVSKLDLQAARGDLRRTSLNGTIKVDHRDNKQFVGVDLRQEDMQLNGNAEVTPKCVRGGMILALTKDRLMGDPLIYLTMAPIPGFRCAASRLHTHRVSRAVAESELEVVPLGSDWK